MPFRPGSPHPHPDGKDFTTRSRAWPTKRSGIRHLPAPRTCTTSERLVSGCGGLAGRMERDQQAQTLAAGNEVGSGGTPCTSLWVSMTNTTTCGSAAASTTARGVRQVTPGAPVDSFHKTPLIRAGGECGPVLQLLHAEHSYVFDELDRPVQSLSRPNSACRQGSTGRVRPDRPRSIPEGALIPLGPWAITTRRMCGPHARVTTPRRDELERAGQTAFAQPCRVRAPVDERALGVRRRPPAHGPRRGSTCGKLWVLPWAGSTDGLWTVAGPRSCGGKSCGLACHSCRTGATNDWDDVSPWTQPLRATPASKQGGRTFALTGGSVRNCWKRPTLSRACASCSPGREWASCISAVAQSGHGHGTFLTSSPQPKANTGSPAPCATSPWVRPRRRNRPSQWWLTASLPIADPPS